MPGCRIAPAEHCMITKLGLFTHDAVADRCVFLSYPLKFWMSIFISFREMFEAQFKSAVCIFFGLIPQQSFQLPNKASLIFHHTPDKTFESL